jgi:serine-aspartate repeat-containing protein C/D/E
MHMNYTKILNPILVLVIGLSLSITSFSSLSQEYIPNPQNPGMEKLGTIKGKVFIDENGNGIDDDAANIDYNGIFLNVLRFPGTTYAQFSLQSSGLFEFAVLPGEYKLEFSFPGGETPTKKGQLSVLNDSDINPDGKTDYLTVTNESGIVFVNAGVVRNKIATIGNYVWNDSNRNGKQDENEKGLGGVVITTYRQGSTTTIATTITATNGNYSFSLPAGNYDFKFVAPKGYSPTIKNNAFNNNDSNIDAMGMIKNLGLFAGEVNNDYDAGFVFDEPLPPPIEQPKPEPKPTFKSMITSFFDRYVESIKKGIPVDTKQVLDSILNLIRRTFGG